MGLCCGYQASCCSSQFHPQLNMVQLPRLLLGGVCTYADDELMRAASMTCQSIPAWMPGIAWCHSGSGSGSQKDVKMVQKIKTMQCCFGLASDFYIGTRYVDICNRLCFLLFFTKCGECYFFIFKLS